MPRPRSAKAMTADLHREHMRETLDRMRDQAANIKVTGDHEGNLHRAYAFIGACDVHQEILRRNLDALDRLAK